MDKIHNLQTKCDERCLASLVGEQQGYIIKQ